MTRDSQVSDVGAVILAAGFGTRLAPLTDTTPKPLLDIGGRPVVSHLLDRLRDLEVGRVVVVVNARHLQQWHGWVETLPPKPTVEIVSNGVTNEHERLGAVSDLAIGINALTASPDFDQVVVLAGDNLIHESLQPHVEAAIRTGAPIVLCRDLGETVPPRRFGEITMAPDGTVTRFREKPADPDSPYAATCTYVLPITVAAALHAYLQDGNADSPGMFMGWLAERRQVIARTLSGTYFDIGNLETLAAARNAHQTNETP